MTKEVTINNGIVLTLHLTEEWNKITFSENGIELDGEFCFEDNNEDGSSFLLRRMYSPNKYKRQGLGEEALRFFKEETNNAIIWTRENDGVVMDDGSNLTENAPSFVRKMQRKKIIADWDNDPGE